MSFLVLTHAVNKVTRKGLDFHKYYFDLMQAWKYVPPIFFAILLIYIPMHMYIYIYLCIR